jgi:spermidine/putrescine transport system permease protein
MDKSGRIHWRRPHGDRLPPLTLLPGLLWIVVFLVAPLCFLSVMTFWQSTFGGVVKVFTLENYEKLVAQPVYLELLFKSTRISLTVTALTLAVAYPFAYWARSRPAHQKAMIVLLILIPFWTSYLVRAYAWFPLLGNNGVLNILLLRLGVVSEPLPVFMFNIATVHLGLLYVYLPYAIIPIMLSLDRLDQRLLDAASDLGATPLRRFLRVTLPLSLPGVLGGAIMVFILCLGAFVVPELLGGTSGTMIASVIPYLFGAGLDWPMGGTISILVMVTTVLWIWLIGSRVGLRKIFVES